MSKHPDDILDKITVYGFADAMREKMRQARLTRGRTGWRTLTQDEAWDLLRAQMAKPAPDPVDVANFAMFVWSLTPTGE